MIKALLTTITVIILFLIIIPIRQYSIEVSKYSRKNWQWKPNFKRLKKSITIKWLNFKVKFTIIDLRK